MFIVWMCIYGDQNMQNQHIPRLLLCQVVEKYKHTCIYDSFTEICTGLAVEFNGVFDLNLSYIFFVSAHM